MGKPIISSIPSVSKILIVHYRQIDSMMRVFVIVSVIFALSLAEKDVVSPNAETSTSPSPQGTVELRTKLYNSLVEDYQKSINPDNPNVEFGLTLLSLDLDEDTSLLDSSVWLKLKWHDSRLTWDTAVFPINTIRLELSSVWHPDLMLFNSPDTFSYSGSCSETNVLVYASGDVLWVPPCHLTSWCKNTLKVHPYAPQVCPLKFGSWTYDGLVMDVNFFNNVTTLDIDDFQAAASWKILSTDGVKNSKVYPCCSEPYTDITYNVTIQKRTEILGEDTCN